jgi:type VI secretion system protein ImpF
MAQSDYDVRVTPSLLDRLLDFDHRNTRDPVPTRAETVREMKLSVQRDLENLLNSRNSNTDLEAAFVEASRSVVTYGLPDLSSMVASPANERRLRQVIDVAIRTFEPRLTGVTSTMLPISPTDRSLRVRVEASLRLDPSPEPVSFDIVTQIPVSYRHNEQS